MHQFKVSQTANTEEVTMFYSSPRHGRRKRKTFITRKIFKLHTCPPWINLDTCTPNSKFTLHMDEVNYFDYVSFRRIPRVSEELSGLDFIYISLSSSLSSFRTTIHSSPMPRQVTAIPPSRLMGICPSLPGGFCHIVLDIQD